MTGPPPPVRLRRADGVATITLDRPGRRNALDRAMTHQLLDSLKKLAADTEVFAVRIVGQGDAFSIGMDLMELIDLREKNDEKGFGDWLRASQEIVHVLMDALPQSTFAVVDGPAAGSGFGIASACDAILATNRATFGATQVRLGLYPDAGLTYSLPRRVRHASAIDMLATGRIIDAHEANRIALVEQIAAPHTLDRDISGRMRRLRETPRDILKSVRRALLGGEQQLHAALEAEHAEQMHAFRSPTSMQRLAALTRRKEREPA